MQYVLMFPLCIYIIDLTIMSAFPKQKQDDTQPILPPAPPQQPLPEVLAITYGQNSISMKCPFCLQHIHSEIILKPELISIVLGISIFVIVPHLAMMLLVIMLMHFTAARKHRCPLCQRELGHDGKFLLYFTDEVYSLTMFSAGFIFTKKMVVTGVLIVFAMTILSLRVAQIENQRWVTTTWPQYVQECSTGSPDNCLQKYHGKEFRNWEGHLLRVMDNRQNPRKYYQHAVSFFMKMEPRVRQDSQPDVLLTLDSGSVYDNGEVLATLQHGDLLRFNCSLHQRYRGTLHDVMHFHVQELQVVGHDQQYAMYTSEIEEEWIRIHVENKGGLTSEPDAPPS